MHPISDPDLAFRLGVACKKCMTPPIWCVCTRETDNDILPAGLYCQACVDEAKLLIRLGQ